MTHGLRPEDLRFDPPQLPIETVASILHEHWGLTGTLTSLDGERDQNTRVRTESGEEYVLKIASPSEDESIADLQCKVLDHVASSDPGISAPRVVPSRDGERIVQSAVGDETMATRLLTFVPGVTFIGVEVVSLATIADAGRFQGRLARALTGFEHPAASSFMAWTLDHGMIRSDELWDGLSDAARSTIEPLRQRTTDAVAALAPLPRQVLHHDGHGGNLLRADPSTHEISGVIDFGDVTETAVVADLAVSAASFGDDHVDPIGALCASARGYHESFPLSVDEVSLLLDLVVARRVLGTLLVEYQARHAPAERFDDIAWELPILRASAQRWGSVDREQAIAALTACITEGAAE